ncbi:hypothetical protein Syun_008450 [Stephania yunnanensis]|uniref:Uncharacterized protein n=1 Tax=Stephania yunnanensis TaxID=152371 RepID=A0AAP0KCL2_9MAGN
MSLLFKVLLVLQLSFLLLSLTGTIASVAGEADVEAFEEIMSPYPRQPIKRPSRDRVAVQGVIYCKSCKYLANDTLLDASPLPGAVAKLECNNTRKPITVEGVADKNGYFLIQAPKKVSTSGVHKCKVFAYATALIPCRTRTDLNGGINGAAFKYQKTPPSLPFALYTVGPFAFEPQCQP